MKSLVEKRKPSGVIDYAALAVTTCGVGYIPGAPGTYGSLIGVGLYLSLELFLPAYIFDPKWPLSLSVWHAVTAVLLLIFCLAGIWASGRSTALLGDLDPSQAVVDEVMGQLIVFLFVPFGIGWPFIVAGFLLFRLFDIWKPYPIDDLQILPGGIGICADDIVAGVYAGVCLSVIYAISISL